MMGYSAYLGHPSQLCSVEEVRLQGGKGDGMRLLQIRNAAGMELTISADRCADISRLIFKGDNMGYFSPCGYVAPSYYDDRGDGFLKSFTAGFLTTCGLTAVGSPCVDAGETLPLHGTIGNTPCDRLWWTEDENNLYIHAEISDSRIFARKLHLSRVITVSKNESWFTVTDTVENQGDTESPIISRCQEACSADLRHGEVSAAIQASGVTIPRIFSQSAASDALLAMPFLR